MSDIKDKLSALDKEERARVVLRSSFMTFMQVFFQLRTGREFKLSQPAGRESHFLTMAKALKSVFLGDINRLIINVPPRYGKALDVNTDILTKTGWKKAKDVQVGDYLVGRKHYTMVKGVHPQGVLPSLNIKFSDGHIITCNDEHKWTFKIGKNGGWQTTTTDELMDLMNEYFDEDFYVPLCNGDFGFVAPLIDPYALGCWLGDTHSIGCRIFTNDEHIIKHFVECGFGMERQNAYHRCSTMKVYEIEGNHFDTKIKTLGLEYRKFIPAEVFQWSHENRLSILEGILDVRGGFGKKGRIFFASTNKELSEGVISLVCSLGGTAKFSYFGEKASIVNIYLPESLKRFKVKRSDNVTFIGKNLNAYRKIKSIDVTEPKEMVCFSVDADDRLFAAGKGLVLTHNSEMMCNFVAWALANYGDSNFIYTSYAHSLASLQTQTIRDIINIPYFIKMFDVAIDSNKNARDDFKTTAGGSVFAAGAGGPITGRGAGIKGATRFGGCIIVDDAHKPEEVHSDVMRTRVNEWFYNTLQSRLNDKNVPIIAIGQMLHEDDLLANLRLQEDDDGNKIWNVVCLPALDLAGNALYPEMHDQKALLRMKKESPYVFSSQYQQDPQPAGGGIFRPEWFPMLEPEPHILSTFITCDTAETDKDYNDATVFSFWGIYRIKVREVDTGMYGLHWIDCREIRVEPKDLENEFYDFYASCMRHRVKPLVAAIEKKSTGVTLCSVLKGTPGLRILEIGRDRSSGSKITRFLECQPYVSAQRISFTKDAKHVELCVTHCKKITSNNTHAHDDIADTMQTAIQVALMDGTLLPKDDVPSQDKLQAFNTKMSQISNLRRTI